MRQYKLLIRKNFAGIAVTAFLIILMSMAMTFAGYSLSFFFTAYEYGGDKIKAICLTFVADKTRISAAVLAYRCKMPRE